MSGAHTTMILVGTSGFSYRHWRGHLYPAELSARLWLERYAEVFNTVELNSTFYRLPTPAAVDRWRQESPSGFVFSCKGSRYLTHLKRLIEVGAGLEGFVALVKRLRSKLGPILWQLPPRMKPNPDRLANFLAHLPAGLRHVFEFRNADWYTEEICELLDRRGVAFCEHDLVDREPPRLTGDFRYLRFHGTTAKYKGRYGSGALQPAARSLLRSKSEGIDSFVYFNNDVLGHALYDALALRRMVGETVSESLLSASAHAALGS